MSEEISREEIAALLARGSEESCDNCKHNAESWDSDACDGCCGANSKWSGEIYTGEFGAMEHSGRMDACMRRETETKLTNGEKLLQVFPYIKVYRFETWVHCYYMDDRYFTVLRKWFDAPVDDPVGKQLTKAGAE